MSGLRVYPVKSLRPMSPDACQVEKRGLQHDRRWMVINEHGMFRTRRELPHMAQINAVVSDGHITLSKEGLETINLPTHPEGQSIEVEIWKTKTTASVVSSKADEWISRAMGQPSRLVYMTESGNREVNPIYNAGNDLVGFADAYPILVASESSLQDLNSRLDKPITIDRFRPNVILKGSEPYEEDTWTRIRIGNVVLRSARPDIRCLVTTQDPFTGEALGPEPLKTLATYRKVEGGVIFGMYYIPETLGRIAVGDVCTPEK